MLSIFYKEINTFFSSLIGYIVIGVFLVFMGLMLWVFPDFSLLRYKVASLDALFEIAPLVFLFLIPAITMRSFAEEKQTGTIELLAGTFVAIGLLASSITNNQIIAFILALFFCFLFYYGFDYLSRLPVFLGKTDDIVQMIGIDYHYTSISRGVLDSRDVIYFLSVIGVFLMGSQTALESRKW